MRRKGNQRGSMVLETVISAAAFVVVALGVQGVVKASDGLQRRTHAESATSASDRKTLDSLANMLRCANYDTMTVSTVNNASTVQFQSVTGMTSGVKTLGTLSTLAWYQTAPVAGVAEPGRIVLTVGATMTTVASRVPRGGFVVTDTGTGLKVHVETFTLMTNGEIARESADTFVALRN
jgi:hypothetical protein